MEYKKAYVFARSPQAESTLVGTAQIHNGPGSFRYADAWLDLPSAYALDPVNLPLSSKIYRVHNNVGVHGVLRDAGPDDWGTRIMLLQNEHAPKNELERLLRCSGGGVGCLRFSLSRNLSKTPKLLPDISLLEKLTYAISRLDEKETLNKEELALVEPGSSMGGARPKVSVMKDGEAWLLKFSRENDLVDMAILEFASMKFLRERLDLNVPEIDLLDIGQGKKVFAIKRFDKSVRSPVHFISANSLFNVDKIRSIRDSRRNPYSYCNFANIIRKHNEYFSRDGRELFTRMVANIAMGNTDDHARNHALICNIDSGAWALSPAYDMLPIVAVSNSKQSMGIGLEGADATFENALSCCRHFSLNIGEAQSIVQHVKEAYRTWPQYCLALGMAEQDVELVKRVSRV